MKTYFLLLAVVVASIAHAQIQSAVPLVTSYQGRVQVGGINFNGDGQFKFALVARTTGASLWSNDGSSVDGSEPAAAVTVAVIDGLFKVLLGDETLPSMLPLAGDLFTLNSDVALRVWFDDGVNGSIRLDPDVRLASVPYALSANVASGSITAEHLAPGAIVPDKLASVNNPVAGRVLSYDGAGFNWVNPSAAGNVWSLNGADAYYLAGNVGIGTANPTPGVRLEVNGNARMVTGGSGGYVQIGTPSGQTGLGVIGVNRFDLRFDGATLTMAAGAGLGPPPAQYGVTVNTNGNIGIGMASPLVASQWKFEVNGPTRITGGGSGGAVQFSAPNGESGLGIVGANRTDLRFDGSSLKIVAGVGSGPPPAENGLVVTTAGNVGIGILPANLAGNVKLDVKSVNGFAIVGRSGFEGVHGESTHTSAAAVAGFNLSTGPGVYGVSQGGGYGGYFVGKVRVGLLEIAGGADLAEPFPMKEEQLEKGSVVVIDEEHPGQLKRSTQAYDTRVAGIISGANGVNPGISLKQEGALDQGENVALTGRVYVQADAGRGAIRPGDLLTTSDTPGHAMKVSNHMKAQGAILGKAMSALKEGKGMVLVLVTLQ